MLDLHPTFLKVLVISKLAQLRQLRQVLEPAHSTEFLLNQVAQWTVGWVREYRSMLPHA